MVYWLRLHPGVEHTGLICRSPLEQAGESVEKYVKAYNRECPKGRQRGRARQDRTDSERSEAPTEGQGEVEVEVEEESEPEPRPQLQPQWRNLSLWKKYGIIRLS